MRTVGRHYRDEWIPNSFPSREVGPSSFLRISRTGRTVILDGDEEQQLSEVFMDEALYCKLERTGHIVTRLNSDRVFEELQTWHRYVYAGPLLHIAVLTTRCNLNCTYCHMNPQPVASNRNTSDMSEATCRAVIQFALSTPNPEITFEFQGGEPFLNFSAMRFFVDEAHRQNAIAGKSLRFCAVTNLLVASDEQLAFCRDNKVSVSYTLNGPEVIHDAYRKSRSGVGSFRKVMRRLGEIRSRFPGLVSATPLCVVDKQNAGRLDEMIEFYYEAGFSGVALIRLKKLGNARASGMEPDDDLFLERYLAGLEFILAKNKGMGRIFSERMLPIALAKILGDSNVAYVDWRNPSGDFGGAITYDVDGEILPTDEARSMRGRFGLGNVHQTRYADLTAHRGSYEVMNASLREQHPTCRECAYNPYCGVIPVVEYAETGNLHVRPLESFDCRFTITLLDWIFAKLLSDPIPLFRMLANDDRVLKRLIERR